MILLRRLGHAVIAGVVPGAKHRLLNLIFVHQGDQLLRRASHAGPAAEVADMGVGIDLLHRGVLLTFAAAAPAPGRTATL